MLPPHVRHPHAITSQCTVLFEMAYTIYNYTSNESRFVVLWLQLHCMQTGSCMMPEPTRLTRYARDALSSLLNGKCASVHGALLACQASLGS